MELYYLARYINTLARIGEPFKLDDEIEANFVWKYIKNKKNFKKHKNTIWRTK